MMNALILLAAIGFTIFGNIGMIVTVIEKDILSEVDGIAGTVLIMASLLTTVAMWATLLTPYRVY